MVERLPRGLAYVGWRPARGGVGSFISAYAPLFVRCLQLQGEINVPLGLGFQEMGQSLPKTHPSVILKKSHFVINLSVKEKIN